MTAHLEAALRELLDELDVAVVTSPLGPPCTVRLRTGEIIEGYRVPDDYAGPEVVHRGECVHAVWVVAGQLHLGGDARVDRMELQVNGAVPPSLERRRPCRRP